MWVPGKNLKLSVQGVELEARCWGLPPDQTATLVLLHEGLGCVDLWRDFPAQLAARTGLGVFAYSRQGYGRSDAVNLPRPIDYMSIEAIDILPQILDQIGLEKGLLIGHSDGATIGAIYAGLVKDERILGLCLMAPHFFTEPCGLASIKAAKQAFLDTDLRPRMAKYHRDVDNAFLGWADAWCDPEFEEWNVEHVIPKIEIPVLAIQGSKDQYGTMAQLDAVQNGMQGKLARLEIAGCKHAPHLECPDQVLQAMSKQALACFA